MNRLVAVSSSSYSMMVQGGRPSARIVSAVGVYYFFAEVGLLNSLTGLVLAHTALGAPLGARGRGGQ